METTTTTNDSTQQAQTVASEEAPSLQEGQTVLPDQKDIPVPAQEEENVEADQIDEAAGLQDKIHDEPLGYSAKRSEKKISLAALQDQALENQQVVLNPNPANAADPIAVPQVVWPQNRPVCRCMLFRRYDYMMYQAGMSVKYNPKAQFQVNQSKNLPLEEVSVDVEIQESVALIKMRQVFVHPTNPSDCPSTPHQKLAAELEKEPLNPQAPLAPQPTSAPETKSTQGENSLGIKGKKIGAPYAPIPPPFVREIQPDEAIDKTQPVEVVYKFPKDDSTVISKLLATIGDRQVEAKIMQNEKAKEKYDDAIAEGKAAVLLKESKDNDELLELDIGNLLPGQEAVIEIHLIQPMKIQGGGFDFSLPMAYFPKYHGPQGERKYHPWYNRMMVKREAGRELTEPEKQLNKLAGEQKISFNFRAVVHSQEVITDLSTPSGCAITDRNNHMVRIENLNASFSDLKKDLHIFYRTDNMDKPRFIFQKSPDHPGHVALMAQFVPTFEDSSAPSGCGCTVEKVEEAKAAPPTIKPKKKRPRCLCKRNCAINDDEDEIDEEIVSNVVAQEKNTYIFVVDRSGSMGGSRIETTKKALVLFIQSLPVGSKFQVISFGSKHEWMRSMMKGNSLLEYNDANLKEAKAKVKAFEANMGGTNIYDPLNTAFSTKVAKGEGKRIFLLTDGHVAQPGTVISLIQQNCRANNNTKVFSFGVGNGASRPLVVGCAKAGLGDYSFVADGSLSELKGKVISSLQKASEPSLQDCTFTFGVDENHNDMISSLMRPHEARTLGPLFRNTVCRCFTVVTEAQFNGALSCIFNCGFDPMTNSQETLTFDRDVFEEAPGAQLNPQDLAVPSQFTQSKRTDSTLGSYLFKLAAFEEIKHHKEQILLDPALMAVARRSQPANEMDDEQRRQLIEKISLAFQVLSSETSFIGVVKQKEKVTGEMKSITMPTIQSFEPKMMTRPATASTRMRSAMSGGPMMMKKKCYQVAAPQMMMKNSLMTKSMTKSAVGNEVMRPAASSSKMDQKKLLRGATGSTMTSMSTLTLGAMPAAKESYGMNSMRSRKLSENELESEDAPVIASKSLEKASSSKLEVLLNKQSAEGSWGSDTLKVIQKCISAEEFSKLEALLKKKTEMQIKVALTVVALEILSAQFSSEKDEWKLIAKKAKKWLKGAEQAMGEGYTQVNRPGIVVV